MTGFLEMENSFNGVDWTLCDIVKNSLTSETQNCLKIEEVIFDANSKSSVMVKFASNI